MKLEKPKAILFDWDNTLADTWGVIYQSLAATFKAMGMRPWTFDEVKKNSHRSMRDYFPVIFGDNWKKAADKYHENFLANHLKQIKPLPDSETVLDILLDTDIFVGVVSNKTGDYLRKEVKHLSWENYFSSVVGAKDAEADKPSPAPVILALKDTEIKPSKDVWFVGDSITDVDCAINSGCKPIFFGDAELDKKYIEHDGYSSSLILTRTHKDFINLIKDF